MFVGSFGMYFISLTWQDRFFVLGMMFAVINIGGLLFWGYAGRRCRIPQNAGMC